ncbi:sulfurtransferase TusA [Marinagarivorans cellulosilyticus]|uniref:tRNA 2-thiouridine synthesizing protein A n=1 Tax=Marinagarivorans cellulosilyticus TaxID=2721545 RepID=A0AAN2BL94_9GAMM|nr:sulfurtransferase TusA [Marinagarivorans cellulosilyticus]BCD98822.1 tRNA 2-thiouridine synthesizing protein A [Marinagarivorans cellulosilyticus]
MTEPQSVEFETLLDTQGLYCPEPVMLLHGAIDAVKIDQVVKVVATDPSTQRDIPKFCDFLGHELLHSTTDKDTFVFYVKRAT